APIYEGTNGIQAIDLVTRKLPMRDAAAAKTCIADIRRTVAALDTVNHPGFGWTSVRLRDAVDALDRATAWMLARVHDDLDSALAGATPYLRLFALAVGGALLAQEALTATRPAENGDDPAGRIASARFFAENFVVAAGGLERVIADGADSVARGAA